MTDEDLSAVWMYLPSLPALDQASKNNHIDEKSF